MPITSFHNQHVVQAKVNLYTHQKNSTEARVNNLESAKTSIGNNPSTAAKFSQESVRAADQLGRKNKSAGYLRQRSDGTPRLTRHMGLPVRATRMIDGLFGSNLSARSSMWDGGFRKALTDAEQLNPNMRNLVDSPYKKITTDQFSGIGNKRVIDENLRQQGKELNLTAEKLASWERLLK